MALVIAVDYEIRREVPDFICGLVIRRFDGFSVAAPNTRLSDFELLAGLVGTRGTV